jgi:hypothetical protein
MTGGSPASPVLENYHPPGNVFMIVGMGAGTIVVNTEKG